ncbi:hypothetical protein M569_11669 [Genlisea aurea]|uniref:Trichome birefringence-like C-terminal domain-containing protein n=1 Tax=Genlisea aurea TaxID=192259 RepID=S8C8I7_9LAMI|nr:hypothetical protein M569_11669 [Genlisea aurea]
MGSYFVGRWGSFDNPEEAIYKTVEMKRRRYEMALNTWAEWVEMNVNRSKTKLYFMGSSPFIYSSGCYNRTEPDFGETRWRNHSNMIALQSMAKQLSERGVKVDVLRITEMSESRKDARPSVFLGSSRAKRSKWIDCVHWCLPGVPDVWNQILYQYIVES